MNLFLQRLWECVAWLIAIVIVGLFMSLLWLLFTVFNWLGVILAVVVGLLVAIAALWHSWTFIVWLFIEPFRRSKR